MASQVTPVVRRKWNLVFTVKKRRQSYKTICKATADGLEVSGLTVSLWDAGDTDVRFLCEGILLFIHPNIKTEEYEWVLKHKCPLSLQLQQVNRLDQRLVLLFKAHSNKMSTLEYFRHAWEDNFTF